MKYKMKLIFSLALIGLVAFSAFGQTFNATVVGKVSDVNGAAIAGAEVVVTQNGTSRSQTTMTNADGEFTVPQLPPGEYKLKITAANFKTAQSGDISLLTDTTSRVDLTLEAGNIAEVVTVNAEPAVINTETTEKGEVILQRQVQELPLNGRDFTDLAKLVPGIYQRPADDDQGQGLAAAGTRTDSTNFSLDGVSNRSDRQGGVGVNTSVDSIQEFKVSTSTYSAELGKLAGAQISVVSKGGTNRYGGTVFEFLRNDYFDAINPLVLPGEDKTLRRHQFGGTFSGPLPFLNFGEGVPVYDSGKDKTFFFTSFEQTREVRSIFTSTVAPNAAWAQGDFRIQDPSQPFQTITCISRNNATGAAIRKACPTPNVIPQNNVPDGASSTFLGINPISRAIQSFLPVANVPGSITGYKSGVLTTILPRNLFSVKIDRKLTNTNNFYFRVSTDSRNQYTPQLGRVSYPGFARNLDYKNISLAFGDTHTFTPTLVNDFRIGYLTQDNKTINENNDVDYIGQFGIPGLPTGQTPALQGFPAIRIDGFPDTGDSANVPFNYEFKNLSIYDSLTWIVGNHNIKIGVDITRPNYIESDIRNVRGDFRFRGRLTNNLTNNAATGAASYADFLLGLIDSSQRQLGAVAANLKAWQSAFYVQDNWRATSWLTLNLGVRYDYTPYLSEKDNRLSNFIPELGISVCASGEIREPAPVGLVCRDAKSLGLPDSLVKTDKNNLAPRFGFAIKPFKDDKTVIRGGAGIFYSTETVNPARQQLANNYPYIFREQYSRSNSSLLLTNLSLQNPFPSNVAGQLQGLTTPQGIPTDSQTPEVYQFNLTVERELTSDLGLEIGYVGSQGRFLGVRYNLNAALPTDVGPPVTTNGVTTFPLITARRYPTLGDITYQVQAVNSNYNALQVAIRRRSKNGLTMLASYTFGRALDQNSNTNNSTTGAQRSPQDPTNFRADYGLSDYHRAHQFSASFNYDLPFGRGKKFFGNAKGWAQTLFGGWQMNGIATLLSGRPFTPVFATADTTGGRPDLVGDPKANIPAGLFFNPAAFARPRASPSDKNLYGTSGRNIVIGPDFKSVDLSLFKNVRLREKMKLQLRWEVFNALNRSNFQIPQPLLEADDTARFRFTSTEAREMQFAAKIIF